MNIVKHKITESRKFIVDLWWHHEKSLCTTFQCSVIWKQSTTAQQATTCNTELCVTPSMHVVMALQHWACMLWQVCPLLHPFPSTVGRAVVLTCALDLSSPLENSSPISVREHGTPSTYEKCIRVMKAHGMAPLYVCVYIHSTMGPIIWTNCVLMTGGGMCILNR